VRAYADSGSGTDSGGHERLEQGDEASAGVWSLDEALDPHVVRTGLNDDLFDVKLVENAGMAAKTSLSVRGAR
jgi:hypothetical protein